MQNPWIYVEQGQFQKAIEAYTTILHQKTKAISIYNRAAAYLCLRDYASAANDYQALIQVNPDSSAGYAGLGVSLWCQRHPVEAVKQWKQALQTIYTDAAGVGIPALLFYAAIRLQDDVLAKEARQLLATRMRRKTIATWPGAIAPYLLKRVSEEEVHKSLHQGVTSDVLLERRRCQFQFYYGIHGLLIGDANIFMGAMRSCANSWYGYLEREYYLAAWEVDHNCGPIYESSY